MTYADILFIKKETVGITVVVIVFIFIFHVALQLLITAVNRNFSNVLEILIDKSFLI